MTSRTVAVSLLLLVAAAPLAADDVHLVNGETFQGVIAEVQGDQVAIRLPHGMIRLPRTRVVRIDRAASAYEEFLARSEALGATASARDWLDLAVWARTRDLPSCARDAALEAARLDPDLDGLAPLLRELGYARDEQLGGWVPYEEMMVRKGYVEVDGRWVPAEVVAEAARQAREEHERQVAERRDAQVDRAITLLALAQVQKNQEESERQSGPAVVFPYGAPVGAPVAVFPGTFAPSRRPSGRPPAGGHHHRPPQSAPPASSTAPPAHHTGSWSDVAKRQPGSIIPLQPSVSASSHPRD
jgi:hypothetical protein